VRAWIARVAKLAALCAVVAVLDRAAVRSIAPNSDAASLVLEGQSVLHGNLLLHGWALSLDSFWTSEVPFYAAAVLVVGVHGVLLALVPAVLLGLVTAVGLMIVADGRPWPAAVAGGVVVVAFLDVPVHALAEYLLLGGAHVGAMLWSLVAFFALRRGRWGAGVVIAIAALTIGMLGDLQTIAYGTGPVFVAGLTGMLRRRRVREGLPNVAAAAGASVLTVVIRELAEAIGTFSIGRANPLAKPAQIGHNVLHLYSIGGELIGLRSVVYGTGGVPGPLQDVHVVGAVFLLLCAGLAAVRLVIGVVAGSERDGGPEVRRVRERTPWWQSGPSGWRLDDMLLLGSIGVALSYLLLAFSDTPHFARYLTGAVVFVVLIAGRQVARTWRVAMVPVLRWSVAALGVAVAACFAAGFVCMVQTPGPARPTAVLARWLEAHGLTDGVAPYLWSSITTVESDGAVRVRPVILGPNGKLVRYERESDAAWYADQRFSFLAFRPHAPWGGVNSESAEATFGPATKEATVDGFEIMVWTRPFTVSPSGGYGTS